MSELQLEKEKLDNEIRAAVTSGDEFLYSKLNRAKDELNQKIFFAENRRLKADIEALESERSFGLSLRSDLIDEAKEASDIVLRARSALFDAEQGYQSIQAKQFFLDTQIEQQRKDIQSLKRELNLLVDKKLNPQNYDEDGNLKRKVGEND